MVVCEGEKPLKNGCNKLKTWKWPWCLGPSTSIRWMVSYRLWGAQVFSMHRALYYRPTRPIAVMATGSVNRTLQLFPELFAEISLDFACRNWWYIYGLHILTLPSIFIEDQTQSFNTVVISLLLLISQSIGHLYTYINEDVSSPWHSSPINTITTP